MDLATSNKIKARKQIELINVELLKHIERFSSKRVQSIKKKIISAGIWNKPICIEKNHFLVMDGQHRLEAARELKFRYIPCLLYTYDEVRVWSLRRTHKVTPHLIIERSLNGDLYPYKTVKHGFPYPIEACSLGFEILKKGE